MSRNEPNLTNAGFSMDTEPRDDHLIDLLGMAYRGDITCQWAVINIELIEPYSDFQPTVHEDYREHFIKKTNEEMPPVMYVYAKDDKFIMSDDYNAFAMYKELGLTYAICIVIGKKPELVGVEYQGEPFIMQPPTLNLVEHG